MSLRFAVSSKEFITTLDRVARVVKSNPRGVPSLLCVKLDVHAGEVYVSAVSTMASVRVQVQGAKVGSYSEPVVVDFEKLRDRISRSGSKLGVEAKGNTLTIISDTSQKIGLVLGDIREFPTVEWEIVEESYGLEKSKFSSILKSASSIAGTSALTPAFLQVYIKEGKIYSASGSSYQISPIGCNPSLVSTIPTQTIPSILSFLKDAPHDEVWLSQHNSDFVVVSVGNDHFQTTPLSVDFPDLEQLFYTVRVAAQNECTLDRGLLINAINSALSSTDEYGTVYLTTPSKVAGSLKIEANSEVGDYFTTSLTCYWTGPGEQKVRFVANDLLRHLKTLTEERVTLKFTDDFRGTSAPLYLEEGEQSAIINQFRI